MGPSRAGTAELTAGAAGLLLIVAMFLPWFGADATLTLPGDGGQVTVADTSLTAWEAFRGEDYLLAATAVIAIMLLLLPARERPTLALAVVAAAAISALAIVLRLIYPPTLDAVETGAAVFETTPRLGVYFGVLYTVAIAWGANRSAWGPDGAEESQPNSQGGRPPAAAGA